MCKGANGADSVQQSTDIAPFDPDMVTARLPFDLSEAVYLEITEYEHQLWGPALDFISSLIPRSRSLKFASGRGISKGKGKGKYDFDDEFDCKGKGKCKGRTQSSRTDQPEARIGMGWYSFALENDSSHTEMWALYQRSVRYSEPFHSLVIFSKGPGDSSLLEFCKLAQDRVTEPSDNSIAMMRYDPGYGFWQTLAWKVPRSLDSVVLDPKAKKELLADLDWFISKETREFFFQHGIPYHRCYLFHGPPGAGKTSMISALAGHLKRSLRFMQMDQQITDDRLRKAMADLGSKSILVLEDVDALFSYHRSSTSTTASLSFSGFINCLDGLAAPEDVIVFMTSNHPEKLDPAMLRPGRVDVKMEFKAPRKEVAAEYFMTFYPNADCADAAKFQEIMGERLANRRVSMAELQHFFLKCHKLRLNASQAAEAARDHHFEEYTSSTNTASYC